MAQKNQVDWNEPELVKWLGNTTRKGTRYVYKSVFRMYAQFTGLTAKHLIDEALEDLKKDVRQRQDVVKTKLLNFYRWLKEEYPRKSRGKGKHEIIGKGVSDSLANTAVMAIRSFYSTYDINVKLKGRQSNNFNNVSRRHGCVNSLQYQIPRRGERLRG